MNDKPVILVTGFEPFAGADDNPSARLVERLAADAHEFGDVVTRVLPVSASRLPVCLTELLDTYAPDVVLGIGEARGCAVVRVERAAVNLLHFDRPDNDGRTLQSVPIVSDAPARYSCVVRTDVVIDAIRAADVPSEPSDSAGTYLCNQMLFLALNWAARRAPAPPVGFLHVPSLPGQNTAGPQCPTMPLDVQLRAVRAAIRALRDARV